MQAVLLRRCIEKQQDFLSRIRATEHAAFSEDIRTLRLWSVELQSIAQSDVNSEPAHGAIKDAAIAVTHLE